MASEGVWSASVDRLVPLDQIDPEATGFRITTRSEIEPLAASIRRLGLLQPPLLAEKSTCRVIISGFRRVAACRQLGWSRLPARVLPQTVPEACCARLAVGENSLARPLNLIETSRALRLLTRTSPDGRLPAEEAAALALPSHPGLAARLMRLEELPEGVREGMLEGGIALAMAEELGRHAPPAADAFARLFRDLGLSLNRQRELLSLVVDIAAREGCPPSEVLADPALQAIVRDPGADRSLKTREIRRRLRRRRFPAISRAEENFETLTRRLDLDDRLQLKPPRDFEGTTFSLTLAFDRLEELHDLRRRLDALARSPELHRLLEGKGDEFAPAPLPPPDCAP